MFNPLSHLKQFRLFVVIACLALGAPTVSTAQLAATPSIQELRVSPGVARRFVMKYSNTGKSPLRCALVASDMGMNLDGLIVSGNESRRGCGAWITLSPKEFTLRPGQLQEVAATIRPPSGVGGGYYATIDCTATPERGAVPPRGMSVEFVRRVSSAVLVSATGARPRIALSVKDIELIAPGPKGGRWVGRASVRNAGNVHFRVAGMATLIGGKGTVLTKTPLNVGRGYLFADGTRRFTANLPARLQDGVYTLKVDIAGPGNIRAGGAQAFTVIDGKARPGQPDAKTLAYLNSAAPFLAIEKPRLHYVLPGGATRADSLGVQNLSSAPVKLVPVLLNWGLDGNADLAFWSGQPPSGRGGSPYIAVSPKEMILPAGGRGRFSIKATCPKGKTGEFYGALFFSKSGESVPSDPKVVRGRACVMTLLVKGTETRTVQPGLVKFVQSGESQKLIVTVTSTGNAMVEIEGRVQVLRGANVAIEKLAFAGPGTILVPGSKATFEVPFKTPLARGQYTGHVFVKVAPSDKETSVEGRFTIK